MRTVFTTGLLLGVLGVTGCLSRPALNRETFTFNPPANGLTNQPAGNRVLGLRKLEIAAPFGGRSLVYRTGEFSYARDPYAEFLESPDEELMDPVREWLRRQSNFKDVVVNGSAITPDSLVEIHISRMFGDFRQSAHPLAILTMQFTFFDAPKGIPGKVIFQREYSRSISLSVPSAAELMKGWDQALGEILPEVSSDLWNSEPESPGRQGQGVSSIGDRQ
jgi:uncharacterized lipoprotein YmbA